MSEIPEYITAIKEYAELFATYKDHIDHYQNLVYTCRDAEAHAACPTAVQVARWRELEEAAREWAIIESHWTGDGTRYARFLAALAALDPAPPGA